MHYIKTTLMNFKIYFIISLLYILCLGCNDTPVTEDIPPSTEENGNEDNNNDNDINPLENIYNNYEWVNKISSEHPRLFFNKKTFPRVKEIALSVENDAYSEIKAKVDKLLDSDLVFKDMYINDGSKSKDHEVGFMAAEAAFVYLITGNTKYLDFTKKALIKITEYYKIRNLNGLNVHWFSYSRIHSLMAYDWIYNDLSDLERILIGEPLFDEILYMLPIVKRPNFNRENRVGTTGGFYNNQSIEWYLGVTFLGTSRHPKALEIAKLGYDSHIKVLEYRKMSSGDDGGAASACLPYSIPDYPWAEFNFFNTFISATGGYNIAAKWDYLAYFPNYIFWNILPGIREFGFGDNNHKTNHANYPILNMHFSQVINFYSDLFPQEASIAKWMMNEWYPRKNVIESNEFPLSRFFLNSSKVSSIPAVNPADKIPNARYFENMGQFFMRSGSGPDDTYATFTVSSKLSQHKHYDNNNFNIFKKGFLTIDSGTRPEPGLHLSHYYPRTIAHNCITILMPSETFPNYWSHGRAPVETTQPIPNDGGQNNLEGTKVVAFDQKNEYVYIASDATDSYNSAKTNLVLRQFVFFPPNNFVVFDRVNSSQKDYSKKWLLHTAYQPNVNGNEFYNNHEEGRLLCKTIYPENSKVELIGGQGKEFWSDGKNWSLYDGSSPLRYPLFGQWRVEVSPSTPQENDIFLHLIQVDDRSKSITSLPSAKKIEVDNMKGVEFKYEDRYYKVLFSISGPAAGKITITENNQMIINENFTKTIKEQSGLSYKE